MASKRPTALTTKALYLSLPHRTPSQRCLVRSMATEAPMPNATLSKTYIDAHLESAPTEPILKDQVEIASLGSSDSPALIHPLQHQPPRNPFLTTAQCTLYSFPRLEPTGFVSYPSTHLLLPLRKDLLHRAVIYEGDSARQGTASTKWRSEVHGSGRKVRPQKGTGRARLGDKKSPMLKGGGVAFGPKPRDFSTGLPRKLYDIAWRTALSYRYRRGQLVVLDGLADIEDIHPNSRVRYLQEMLRWHHMGQPDGRTLIVTETPREALFGAIKDGKTGIEAEAAELADVDVKDLLHLGRIVIEKDALNKMLLQHQTDLSPTLRFDPWRPEVEADAPPS